MHRLPPAHVLLGTSRLGVGVVTLLAPQSALARVFGVPPTADPWITRLFGSRELALAVGLLAVPRPHRRTVALVGAAIDATDVASTLVERHRGTLTPFAAVSGGGGAATFTALGLLAVREPATR